MIKAFLAVYKLLPESESRHEDYYFGNLGGRGAGATGPITSEHVVNAAKRCILKVETAKQPYTPIYAGRNLYAVLDGERIGYARPERCSCSVLACTVANRS